MLSRLDIGTQETFSRFFLLLPPALLLRNVLTQHCRAHRRGSGPPVTCPGSWLIQNESKADIDLYLDVCCWCRWWPRCNVQHVASAWSRWQSFFSTSWHLTLPERHECKQSEAVWRQQASQTLPTELCTSHLPGLYGNCSQSASVGAGLEFFFLFFSEVRHAILWNFMNQ